MSAIPAGVSGPLLAADRGPRFAAWVGRPDAAPWASAADLFGSGLAAAVAAVGEARGAANPAVAGALLFEGYAMRLIPPVLAAALTEARAPDPGLDAVRVEWADARVGQVALDGSCGAASEVVPALMERNLAVALDAVHRAAGTGLRVLRGAAAHAVTVTALHLSWPDEQPARYLGPAREVLDRWGVGELVRMAAVPVAGERWLYAERRSCCLAFRTADHRRAASFCATCPVTPEAERRGSFHDAVGAFIDRTGRARRGH
ncbi:(2Fe-2S)-binding protein [Actinomycetospora endophytica]|uniref:(2Fe-2S)-binding protein n=1 Tax=Actinomycetospora endophytica TaxID=2291215 RepID=A0ABS8PH34_9PSEU|nr:(2Fe-2S)-binding protein [Actinomycetospora endophytica]MCD2197571.1 (2Fe-2S)-binding protein [Actinomycetospora endophytica]